MEELLETVEARLGIALVCLLAGTAAHAALKVFACEPEWGALARELGGPQVEVTVATTALQDPHHIQARPSLIARARSADLVVCTGAELEEAWLPLLLGLGPGDVVAFPRVAYPTYDVGARLAGSTPVAVDALTALGPATAATTPTVAGIATSAPPPIAAVMITAPIIRATKQAAARPVSAGTNIAIAPASSSRPMMYIPGIPRPIASNPAEYASSASPTLRSSSAASAIAAGAVGALRWAMPGR